MAAMVSVMGANMVFLCKRMVCEREASWQQHQPGLIFHGFLV
jgi:hypothetical protein